MLVQTPNETDSFKYYRNKVDNTLILKQGNDFPKDIYTGMDYDIFEQAILNKIGNLRIYYKDKNSLRQNDEINLPEYENFNTYKSVVERGNDIVNKIVEKCFPKIGGLLTLGGVIITINTQNKKDKEANKMRIKPYLYANNPYQIIKGLDNADSFVMLNENGEKGDYEIEGIIKNTDNAILILRNVIIDGKYYYPEHGNVIDKNTVFYLYVFPNKIENDSNIYLTITDVMNNEYYYKMTCSFDGKKYYGINALEERISI